MPCSAQVYIDYPRINDDIGVACPPNLLGLTNGRASSNCHAQNVRARLNGGAWKTNGASSFPPATSPPPYATTWSVNDVPNIICNGNNRLEVELQLSDGTWHAANAVNFRAHCGMMPPPTRINTAETMYTIVEIPLPPGILWGLSAGKLVSKQTVAMHRVLPPQHDLVQWKSSGSAAGLWTLTMTGPKHATLSLSLSAEIEDETIYLEQEWGCGDFNPRAGGIFGPTKNAFIPYRLIVSDEQPALFMAMSAPQTRSSRKAKKPPKTKGKRAPKAKAKRKPKTKKGRKRR